jgi:Fe-S cluster assembly protein SufD
MDGLLPDCYNLIFEHNKIRQDLLSDNIDLNIADNNITINDLNKPLQILYINSDIQNNIKINNNIILIENYQGDNNIKNNIICADDTKIQHYKFYLDHKAQDNIAESKILINKNAEYKNYNICLSGRNIKNNINIDLNYKNSSCILYGLYYGQEQQNIKNYTNINHNTSHAKSIENYKGVLDDNSCGHFDGIIHVAPDAQQIDSVQLNKNLLLSDNATVFTKPALSIYADDVKCAHGATVGDLDKDELFYLQSRGIHKKQAYNILVYAFMADIIEKIADKKLYSIIKNIVQEKMGDVEYV